MDRDAVYLRLNELFRHIFDDDGIEVSAGTTAPDVDGWDSLSNIQLIVAVENEFEIRLSAAQAARLPNVGALVDVIMSKVVPGQRA